MAAMQTPVKMILQNPCSTSCRNIGVRGGGTCTERRAERRAVICAENDAETVQNLPLIGCAEKMAAMQNLLQKPEGQVMKVVWL